MQDNVDYSGYPLDDLLLRHDFDYVRGESGTSFDRNLDFIYDSIALDLFIFFLRKLNISILVLINIDKLFFHYRNSMLRYIV